MYRITSSSLQKTEKVELEVGKMYFMGASGRPSVILITGITDQHTAYVNLYDAETKDAKVMRQQSWILQDLVSIAQETIKKQHDNTVAMYSENSHPLSKLMVDCAKRDLGYIGGKEYRFEVVYTCNCCNDDFDASNDPDVSPCCESDWRKTQDASRYIGRTI